MSKLKIGLLSSEGTEYATISDKVQHINYVTIFTVTGTVPLREMLNSDEDALLIITDCLAPEHAKPVEQIIKPYLAKEHHVYVVYAGTENRITSFDEDFTSLDSINFDNLISMFGITEETSDDNPNPYLDTSDNTLIEEEGETGDTTNINESSTFSENSHSDNNDQNEDFVEQTDNSFNGHYEEILGNNSTNDNEDTTNYQEDSVESNRIAKIENNADPITNKQTTTTDIRAMEDIAKGEERFKILESILLSISSDIDQTTSGMYAVVEALTEIRQLRDRISGIDDIKTMLTNMSSNQSQVDSEALANALRTNISLEKMLDEIQIRNEGLTKEFEEYKARYNEISVSEAISESTNKDNEDIFTLSGNNALNTKFYTFKVVDRPNYFGTMISAFIALCKKKNRQIDPLVCIIGAPEVLAPKRYADFTVIKPASFNGNLEDSKLFITAYNNHFMEDLFEYSKQFHSVFILDYTLNSPWIIDGSNVTKFIASSSFRGTELLSCQGTHYKVFEDQGSSTVSDIDIKYRPTFASIPSSSLNMKFVAYNNVISEFMTKNNIPF
jgi:hypothetical protein